MQKHVAHISKLRFLPFKQESSSLTVTKPHQKIHFRWESSRLKTLFCEKDQKKDLSGGDEKRVSRFDIKIFYRVEVYITPKNSTSGDRVLFFLKTLFCPDCYSQRFYPKEILKISQGKKYPVSQNKTLFLSGRGIYENRW